MKQMHIPRRLMLSGSIAAAVLAGVGLSALAQTATTTITTSTTSRSGGDLTTASTAPKSIRAQRRRTLAGQDQDSHLRGHPPVA